MTTIERERMKKTLNKKMPDKVPHGEVMIDDLLVERITGIKMPYARANSTIHWAFDWLSDEEFEAHLNVRKVLGCDFVVVFPGWKMEKIGENENGYPVMKDIWGRVIVSSPNSVEVIHNPIEDLNDLKNFQFPEPGEFMWDNIKRWKNNSPFFVACQIDVGFSMFVDLVGFERIVFAIKDERNNVKDFARRYYAFAEEMAQKAIEEGAECIWLADDFAHNRGTFISPGELWEIDFQFMKLLVDSIHKRDIPVNLHACGRVIDVMNLLVDIGIESLHAIQPTAGNDIFSIKREYGDKLALIGNLDLNELLSFGSPWEIDVVVKDLVEEIGWQGGYILSSCNSLTSAVPVENALTAHLACEKYGRRRHNT